jgi:protocatechuate 3,4-dioxygenase beta subunit
MTSLSRRFLFKTGLVSSLIGLSSKTLANWCFPSTGKQSLGPFFPNENTPIDPIIEDQTPGIPLFLANDNDLTKIKGRELSANGQVVFIEGKVLNKKCEAIPGATVIAWQASSSGRYNHKGDDANHDFPHPLTGQMIKREHDQFFQYWGKSTTDESGNYSFKTIVPGFYPADLNQGWYRPPHIHFMINAPGHPQLITQMYFKGDQLDHNDWIQKLNAKDLLLQASSLTIAQRQELIVEFKPHNHKLLGKFDIKMN